MQGAIYTSSNKTIVQIDNDLIVRKKTTKVWELVGQVGYYPNYKFFFIEHDYYFP